MLENFDFAPGKIVKNNFHIDPNKPLKDQLNLLDRDMLQVSYLDGKYIFDIGWYPPLSLKGFFVVRIVQDNNWEKCYLVKRVKSLTQLHKAVEECLGILKELM